MKKILLLMTIGMMAILSAACDNIQDADETAETPQEVAIEVAEPAVAKEATDTPAAEEAESAEEPGAEPDADESESSEEPAAEPAEGESETAVSIDLTLLQGPFGAGWTWASYDSESGNSLEVENSERYTLIFIDETSVGVVSDCNFSMPTYTVSGSQLAINMETADLIACEEGSRSEQFLELVASAGTLTINGESLLIDLQDNAGTLVFQANDPQAAFRVESWEEAAEKFLEDCDAPGAVLLVDGPEGRFLQAYGLANTDTQTPMQTSDRFEIGSNTKSFTVVLALQLQEEGVWSLDDPLEKWLPDVAARIPNGDLITLRQLASNTSGVWDYADPLITAALNEDKLEQAYTHDELIDYIVENGEPSFAPGEGAQYSSSNFVLLGEAIEAATGETVANLYQARIFDPLGMDSSSLLEGVPEDGAIVNGYYTDELGQTTNTTKENGSQMWAAGGIISTAEDMAKYAAALSGGSLFQDFDSFIQMTDFGDEYVASFIGYGLGVGQFSEEPLAWGHGGQTAGFQTLFAIFPSSSTNFVLLTNSASCSVQGLMTIIQASPALLPTEG